MSDQAVGGQALSGQALSGQDGGCAARTVRDADRSDVVAIAPRAIVGWHVAFWLLLGLGMAIQLVPDGDPFGQRMAALAVLLLLGGIHVATVGHSRRRVTGPAATFYLVCVVVITGVGVALDTQLSLLLFLAYPHIWFYCPSLRAGMLFTVALTAGTVLGFSTRYGFSRESLQDIGPNMLAGMLFSILLGIWIDRVIRESLERAQLISQLEATRAELARAHHAQGVTAERERMAREIHDTLAQGFTSVIMLAQTASAEIGRRPQDATARLAQIEEVARENLAEARGLVAAFSPVGLDDGTLQQAVTRLGERFGRETGIRVDVEVSGDLTGLSRDHEVVLVRAAQEALTNVRRHARASGIVLRLAGEPGRPGEAGTARIEVDDDGVGFDPASLTGGRHAGFGLDGMRGRAAEVGGTVSVASTPGVGTRVTVQVPVAGHGARTGQDEREVEPT